MVSHGISGGRGIDSQDTRGVEVGLVDGLGNHGGDVEMGTRLLGHLVTGEVWGQGR